MELYLIRHGQSTNNALMEDQHLRVGDPALTEIGKEQARRVARFLAEEINIEDLVHHPVDAPERQQEFPHQFTHLYTSAMHRALQTTQPIAAALGIVPEVWPDVHESGGIFIENGVGIIASGGKTRSQIRAEFPDYVLPESVTEAGWWALENGRERHEQFLGRVKRVAAALKSRAGDEATLNDKVAIVSHGMFVDNLIKALWGILPDDERFFSHYNTAVTRVDFIPYGPLVMRYLNRVTHLPAELIT